MPRTIVTLTTDFGLADHFVGVMKGVILRICPTAEIVDLNHQIHPFEIPEAGFTIAEAYRFFPNKTVHVVVVDPGVGTSRRPILVQAAGQNFVAPDNGVLSMVFAREKHRVRHVTAERYFLKPVSQTFHGRDIFAPVAAHVAKGVPPARLGKLIDNYARLDFYNPVRTGRRFWTGTVLKIDRFGNLITNFHISEFPTVKTRPFVLAIGAEKVTETANTFTDCPLGELRLIEGSSGYLEVVAHQASAARRLGCGLGAPAELTVY
ncbi:MAG: SAM-dependent chlorinase/fluorinase [Acidobacteria bacterium]|nr:SAM-dependent chlorinase/fluorinase [Acidobacteriota bacterium]